MKLIDTLMHFILSLAVAHGCISQLRSHDFRYEDAEIWSDEYNFCGGDSQSPIDLNYCQRISDKPIVYDGHWAARPAGFTMINTNTTAEIIFSGAQPTLADELLNSSYTFSQMHFHWGGADEGSEHAVNDSYYGMEAHMVHFRTDYGSVEEASNFPDGLVVVALLFEISNIDNPELDDIISKLPEISLSGSTTLLEKNAMLWLEPHLTSDKDFLAYKGSLTTPPCNEVVSWFVLHGTVAISRYQVEQFRHLLDDQGTPIVANRRPLQMQNDRRILCTTF